MEGDSWERDGDSQEKVVKPGSGQGLIRLQDIAQL